MWLQHAKGLPTYSQGKGWFNVGDIISLMPLELTCRILGIKCWVSETHWILFNTVTDSFFLRLRKNGIIFQYLQSIHTYYVYTFGVASR